jgi:hypothetical protein
MTQIVLKYYEVNVGTIALPFYFVIYNTLFNSLPYDRNATHKYLSRIANNNIQET